ncbi:MAG: type II toxin-antitoxin system VapC family toxin [Anaerolineae bacterium]|nr:type II toxin-antitoxin system VapC family toxin [Anaerolineae bacterium]MBL8104454.1 type II toxin-antitoxin system VapC family toxin [Anaerolineales bacterium]MCC7189528.1 type II toxin-antitoxin system VapC family toxin [Anaerolineales bacterium]
MNVVDSSGWLEYFAEGKNAIFFSRAIQSVEELIVPTVCIYEVFRRMLVLRGKEDALQAVGVMSFGKIVELDRQTALNAANLANDTKLAMADSIILATARANDAILWTQDEHFKDLDGVKYIEKK